MASISSRTLFLTTSPRTPEKMVPEIRLLVRDFSGQPWNVATQRAFMAALADEQFFCGDAKKDPAFSARDRINRAPKSLGFVTLKPAIALTAAGHALLNAGNDEEVWLRQLLKFQLPSPYHRPTARAASFCIRPYLEILRLVRVLGLLTFDELQIFGLQLTDWHDFEHTMAQIRQFRTGKELRRGHYKAFKAARLEGELRRIYAQEIAHGTTKTRESKDRTTDYFLRTKANNLRDYADACFRYLRATGLVSVSHICKSISIAQGREEDTDFILRTIDRDPCHTDDLAAFEAWLGDAGQPALPTDDRARLLKRLRTEFPEAGLSRCDSTEKLKKMLSRLTAERKAERLRLEVRKIKDRELYDDIQQTFSHITDGDLYDAPLVLEWNMWRAMTMLDGGEIRANLRFDDFGQPMSTAQGNVADIVCDYGDFLLTVEVTLSSGQRQYDMEGEPVSRHLGQLKKASGKPCFCMFVAPVINEACVAHFYALSRINIAYYGGRSVILPLPLADFRNMLAASIEHPYRPNSALVRRLFDYSDTLVSHCQDETTWYSLLRSAAKRWVSDTL